MAVDELTCGQGGSNGAEIIARLNELTKLDPKVSMRLTNYATHPTQVINDDPTPVLLQAFDTIITERTGFVAEVASQSLKNNSGHPFNSVNLTFGLNVEIASTEKMQVYLCVNGEVVNLDTPIVITGGGTGNPVEITWDLDGALPAGAVVDLRARNAATGTLTIKYLLAYFRMEASWRETLQV
jgi:hypothetical protein